MPGPMSLPAGDKHRWNELNEVVCDIHFHCEMQEFNKDGEAVKHEYITYREWLARRHRLTTGKTK